MTVVFFGAGDAGPSLDPMLRRDVADKPSKKMEVHGHAKLKPVEKREREDIHLPQI